VARQSALTVGVSGANVVALIAKTCGLPAAWLIMLSYGQTEYMSPIFRGLSTKTFTVSPGCCRCESGLRHPLMTNGKISGLKDSHPIISCIPYLAVCWMQLYVICRCRTGVKIISHFAIIIAGKREFFSLSNPSSSENRVIFRRFRYFPIIVHLRSLRMSISGIYCPITQSP
jgi:hypothetical protein